MSYMLSLLDKSPVQQGGETAVEALARTAALARLAEKLGYSRFWVAEHHDSAELASPSPELVAAYPGSHINSWRHPSSPTDASVNLEFIPRPPARPRKQAWLSLSWRMALH